MKVRRITLSSTQQVKNKLLSEMIEKILFEEKELDLLKNLIEDVRQGKVEPKQLRATIIENRVKILDKLLKIFPYYHKQIAYQQEIDKFTKNDTDIKLKKELEELHEQYLFLVVEMLD